MNHESSIREAATRWAVRTGDPSFDDWEAFTLWLEEDPAHARAYDTVISSVDEAAGALMPAAAPSSAAPVGAPASAPAAMSAANDDGSSPWAGRTRPRRRRTALVALAAAVATVFTTWMLRESTYSLEAEPGAVMMVELEGGGRVELAGGTRIRLVRGDAGRVVLEHGEAVFTLDGSDERPFQVQAGRHTLVDIGTVFNVKHSGSTTSVAVAEGAVLFNPQGANIRVDSGQQLTAEGADYRLTAIAIEQIGEWREGRLTFDDWKLGEIAEDLSRATGLAIEVAGGAADVRISGSLQVEPIRADPLSLGPLLGVEVRQEGDSWAIDSLP